MKLHIMLWDFFLGISTAPTNNVNSQARLICEKKEVGLHENILNPRKFYITTCPAKLSYLTGFELFKPNWTYY